MGSVGCFGQNKNKKRQSLTYFEHFMTDKCKPPKTDVYPVCYGVAPDTLYETLPACLGIVLPIMPALIGYLHR